MTAKLIRKNLPKRVATAQGHLDQDFKNLKSTKTPKDDLEEDIAPSQETNNIKTSYIMCMIITTTDICKSYSDQSGKFPITSSRGHRYIFVFYHYDTNNILGIPIKSRNTSDLCEAWLQVFQRCKAHGETPNTHTLENEYSREMKHMFENEDVAYQLVPPHIH